MRRVARVAVLVAGMFVLGGGRRASGYCPSYTPALTAGGARCGVEPVERHNPSVPEWTTIFARVSGGSAAWGSDGPQLGSVRSGCGKPTLATLVAATFPCHVLKAIAMQESGWQQFCVPDTPAASKGAPERTIVTADCGYGVGQVTSGMHIGETPDFDRTRVASEATYNLATGTRILQEKWSATRCVGDRKPAVVEDWYTAMWAYNGLSYVNNPNNPNLKAGRGPYNPKNGGAYAYQERVLGWMEFPPTSAHWPKLEPAYPNRGEIGDARSPGDLSEPACASPTSCVSARAVHTSTCDNSVTLPIDGGALDGGVLDGAVPKESPVDAGRPSAPDGTASSVDAARGTPAPPPGDSNDTGCGCRVSGRTNAAWPMSLAALAGLAAVRRRRPPPHARAGSKSTW